MMLLTWWAPGNCVSGIIVTLLLLPAPEIMMGCLGKNGAPRRCRVPPLRRGQGSASELSLLFLAGMQAARGARGAWASPHTQHVHPLTSLKQQQLLQWLLLPPRPPPQPRPPWPPSRRSRARS